MLRRASKANAKDCARTEPLDMLNLLDTVPA